MNWHPSNRLFATAVDEDEDTEVPSDTTAPAESELDEQREEAGEDPGYDGPHACSYCGGISFKSLPDTGRTQRAECAQCGGVMYTHGEDAWQPELIGDPANHPKDTPDPASGGVGGAANIEDPDPYNDAAARHTSVFHEGTASGWPDFVDDSGHLSYPIHRGMTLWADEDLYHHLTDSLVPAHKRSVALLEHIRNHIPHAGMHWTDDERYARQMAASAGMHNNSGLGSWQDPTPPSGQEDARPLPVVLHARGPHVSDIETNPSVLDRNGVRSDFSEGEVPLRSGAPVHLTGVSWNSYSGARAGDGSRFARPWDHHDFAETQHREAARYPYRVTTQTATGYEDQDKVLDGPLYHGGHARLQPGEHLTPGQKTSPWGDEGAKSTHVHFTTDLGTASDYAKSWDTRGHVYEVEPTGEFKPGYGGFEFKTQHPMRVVREVPRDEWGMPHTAAVGDSEIPWCAHLRQGHCNYPGDRLPGGRVLGIPQDRGPCPWKFSAFQQAACFGGETEFLTYDGVKTLKECVGSAQKVLTSTGRWVDAEIREFGIQKLYAITLRRNKQEKIVYATAGHRWFLRPRARDRVDDITNKTRVARVTFSPEDENWCPAERDVARHELSILDEQRRTALCSVCGPTRVIRHSTTTWMCIVRKREKRRISAERKRRGVTSRRQGLLPGDTLQWITQQSLLDRWYPNPMGVAHGLVYGDGSREANDSSLRGNGTKIQLFGEKNSELLSYFAGCRMHTMDVSSDLYRNVGATVVSGMPGFFKDRPSLHESAEYLYGWLAGYFAADGWVNDEGTPSLDSASREDLEFVLAVCNRLTIATYTIREQLRRGCRGSGLLHEANMARHGRCDLERETPLYRLGFVSETMRPEFFLTSEHRRRFEARAGGPSRLAWVVESIDETDREETVYCAVVPETASFALEGNILTGNCPISDPGPLAVMQVTAGQNGPMPEMNIEYVDHGRFHHLRAVHPEAGRIGGLTWRKHDDPKFGIPAGEVENIWVHPDFQRHGVATALWGHAQNSDIEPKPRHSPDQSDAGEAWAQHVGGRAIGEPTDQVGQNMGKTYWRVHPNRRPFDSEHAHSREWGDHWSNPRHEYVHQGFSAFEDPKQLYAYFGNESQDEDGQPSPHGELPGSHVVKFHGHEVGRGDDGEPLVIPSSSHHEKMDWSDFKDRVVGKDAVAEIDKRNQFWHEASHVAGGDYHLQHTAPDAEYGAPLHNVESMMPEFYEHPEWYNQGQEDWHTSANKIRGARGKPDKKIRVYRSLPAEHAHEGIHTGDWVSTSRHYARGEGMSGQGSEHDMPVISAVVPAQHLHTEGDVHEWGYNGPEINSGHTVAFKGGYHQEVRQRADGSIQKVQRRPTSPERQTADALKEAGYSFRHYGPNQHGEGEHTVVAYGPDENWAGILKAHPNGEVHHVEIEPGHEDQPLEQHMRSMLPPREGSAHTAGLDKEALWHFTATWADVRNKAKRIRSEGGVRIAVASSDGIGGEVQGDHHIYETMITFVPGTHKVGAWDCGCAWSGWTWGRSPAYARFEGRMCSHALAMQFEAQSRGMFGATVTEDTERPSWMKQTTPIVVQYERPSEQHPRGRDLTRRAVPPGNTRHLWTPNSRTRRSSLETASLDPEGVYAEDHGLDLAHPPVVVLAQALAAEQADPADIVRELTGVGLEHHAAQQITREALGLPVDCDMVRTTANQHEGLRYQHNYQPGFGMVRALDGDTRVGDLTYAPVEHDPTGERHYITTLYVHPDYRRHGVASAMYEVANQHHSVEHSPAQTPEGAAWAQHVGRITAEDVAAVQRLAAQHIPATDTLQGHQETQDARQHAPEFGEGVSNPAHLPVMWCTQCRGIGCGHCGGIGQVLQMPGGTANPVPDQNEDAGDATREDGIPSNDDMGATAAKKPEYYHGTRYKFQRGQELTGGHATSNQGYGQPGGHVYYTGRHDIASLFAEAAYGPEDDYDAKPRVYRVEPIEGHEPDPDESPEAQSYRARRVRVLGPTAYDAEGVRRHYEGAKRDCGPVVAGVCLKAADTGRILMLQRGYEDDKDPARGQWEFPGGHIEDGDKTSLHGGVREWEEEVGQPFPEGGYHAHSWRSPNGVYESHVIVVPEERALVMHDGRVTTNPDDPKGDKAEQAAWWEVDHARKNPALRSELKTGTPWSQIAKAGEEKMATRGKIAGDNAPGQLHGSTVTAMAEVSPEDSARIERIQRIREDRAQRRSPTRGEGSQERAWRLLNPQPYTPPPAPRPVAEPVNTNSYSLDDVSRHYPWEGFDAYEISHLVREPHHAQFSLEDVPTHSLRLYAGPHHEPRHPYNYHELAATDDDENERLTKLETPGAEDGPVPPIVTVRDGEHHLIADGSHRAAIALRNGESHIRAFVTPRTRFDSETQREAIYAGTDAFGSGQPSLEESRPMDAPPHSNSTNPASTGFATAHDPRGWDRDEGLMGARDDAPMAAYEATLHDEPEPALPSTDGAEDVSRVDTGDSDEELGTGEQNPVEDEVSPNTIHSAAREDLAVADIVARFQATGAAKTLMSDNGSKNGGPSNGDIASAAAAFLQKSALKDFSAAEQADIINEGARDKTRARNFDELHIEGTHYETLANALDKLDTDDVLIL